jgi:UDP-glucose 4-epimerase
LIALAENPQVNGEVYNIGSVEEISVLELAQKIKAMTSSQSRIVFIPYEKAYEEGFEDMMRRVPDITKINRLNGYAPAATLDEMLLDTIRYHEHHDLLVRN